MTDSTHESSLSCEIALLAFTISSTFLKVVNVPLEDDARINKTIPPLQFLDKTQCPWLSDNLRQGLGA